MAKIIKLNENDLKRIVTKVLNERRLNEEDEKSNNGLAAGAITKEVADQLKYTENETGEPIERFRSICDICISGKDGLGPLSQSEAALDGIAEKIYNAIEETEAWYTFGGGTNEKSVKNGILSTKTFPDFCYMIDSYSKKYEDFYTSVEGDFEDDADQRIYLLSPIVDVIKASTKLIGKKSEEVVNTDDKTNKDLVGGGGEKVQEEDNWNRFLCVVEHPNAIPDKFEDGKRTRFIIGSTYYMGNGKKIKRGVELDYSCDDPEFEGVEFVKDEDPSHGGPSKGKTDINSEVKDIQRFLTDEGYDISNDGKIGPETTGAIIDYIVDGKTGSDSFKPASVIELQKKINSCYTKNIKEDGKVGPETLNAIADSLESAQQGDLC